MRSFSVPNWANRDSVPTDSAPSGTSWVGIAIGPRSQEAVVEIDGVLLQAGRVLPLRSTQYNVKRVRPRDAALTCIASLELMLFECEAELGAEVARPNGIFSQAQAFPAADGTMTYTIPFVGRRQALFNVYTAKEFPFSYTLRGLRYQNSMRQVTKTDLHAEASIQTVTPEWTYAFYVGGTDNAECWDALEFAVADTSGTDDGDILGLDVETIGEIGAR